MATKTPDRSRSEHNRSSDAGRGRPEERSKTMPLWDADIYDCRTLKLVGGAFVQAPDHDAADRRFDALKAGSHYDRDSMVATTAEVDTTNPQIRELVDRLGVDRLFSADEYVTAVQRLIPTLSRDAITTPSAGIRASLQQFRWAEDALAREADGIEPAD